MKLKFKLLIYLLCGIQAFSNAQNVPYSVLYDDTMVNSIYITIDPDSLNIIFEDLENEYEHAVLFVYVNGTQSDTVQNVGFRLRGNTSLYAAKKSYKLSFNTYDSGRKFEGAKKLNLIGNHNDPTMSREKIYFDLYNALGLPARRVSFVKFYINNTYYGLYTLTEEYDDIFLNDRFGESTGNIYKCIYGSDLSYQGTNQSSYNSYELQSNEQLNDKSDLIHFVDVLNNTPSDQLACEIEKIFNVESFLKVYALDVSTGHWDNYGANQNNLYLYHNQFTDKFEFLSYDCDNVLGIDWFGIDWSERNIYEWNFDDRPLVERLFEIQEYRDLFSYYIDLISSTVMDPEMMQPRLEFIRDLIAEAAAEDIYRTYDYGFSYDDFWNGFNTNNIDGHIPYGIQNFIDTRVEESFYQLELNNIAPIIQHEEHFPLLPQPAEEITIRVTVKDDAIVNNCVFYYSGDNVDFLSMNLFDDGAHNDLLNGDDIYGGNLFSAPDNSILYYYFEATDNVGSMKRYPYCETYSMQIGYSKPTLVINEFLAINESIITDEYGEFADYIEIYNAGNFAISLKGKFISDNFNDPTKWPLPEMMLAPDQYLLIWADDETAQGPLHCNFKLDGSGEELGIFSEIEYYFQVIDQISFGDQSSNISTGRIPNGTGDFVLLLEPSPGENNEKFVPEDSVLQYQFTIAGNPSVDNSNLILTLEESASIQIELYTLNGQLLQKIENGNLERGQHQYTLNTGIFSKGLYFIKLANNNEITFYKLLVL